MDIDKQPLLMILRFTLQCVHLLLLTKGSGGFVSAAASQISIVLGLIQPVMLVKAAHATMRETDVL